MFVRFVTSDRDPEAPGPLGIFRAAGNLRDSQDLDEWTAQRLDEILNWFNKNLPCPRLDSRYWRAVFWFNADCQEMVSRLWELVAMLKDHAVQVQLVRATQTDVNVVVYRDEYQIAAMPMKRAAVREFRRRVSARVNATARG
jgi:hypothetical protein